MCCLGDKTSEGEKWSIVTLEIGLHWALIALALFTSPDKMVNNLMSTSEERIQIVKTVVQSYSRQEQEAIYYLSKELARYEKQ